MALSLRETLAGCAHLSDEAFGRLLREQLTWEVGKGMNVGKPISYYLLRVKRRYDSLREQQPVLRKKVSGTQPQAMSEILAAAMEAQG